MCALSCSRGENNRNPLCLNDDDITGKFFVFGGYGGKYLQDAFCLNASTLTWSKPRVGGVCSICIMFVL